jgi:molybdate transport system substrate-binding protein
MLACAWKGLLMITIWTRPALAMAAAALLAAAPVSQAAPETVEVFSAGSLREVWNEVGKEAAPALGIEVKTSFGGSGLMRERIEKGEKPDLFTSADLGSPRKLEAQGRTVVPVVAMARNRMCIVSRRTAGVTADNLIDRMLAKDVRLKTGPPVADPGGDYAWAIFDRIDALRPGSGAILKAKAQASMNLSAAPATPNQSPYAALFESGKVDMVITYCSHTGSLEKDVPELTSLEVPPRLAPHPVYGLAVLSGKPAALRLALFLVSEKGQAIIAKAGLLPIAELPAEASRAPAER